MNAREYAEQLAQAAGLSQEEKDNFLKVVSNEKLAKGLEEGVMLRSDYSRQSDQLKATEKRTNDYYQTLVQWRAEEAARLGAGNGDGSGQVVNGEYLTKKDLDALKKEYQDAFTRSEQSQIALLKDGMRLASQHAVEFKEPLDTDALAKIAVEKNISLRAAYDDMVSPRRTEFSEAKRKQDIVDAEARGARDFASKHKIPVDTAPREHHVMFDRDPSGKAAGITDYEQNSGRLNNQQSRTLRENFVAEWDKAGAQTSGT